MTVYHTVFYKKKNQWLFIYSWSRSWYPIDCQYNAWFVSEGVNILFAQRLLSMAFPSNGIHVLWYKSIPLLLKITVCIICIEVDCLSPHFWKKKNFSCFPFHMPKQYLGFEMWCIYNNALGYFIIFTHQTVGS